MNAFEWRVYTNEMKSQFDYEKPGITLTKTDG
jgi:hypothetical protein